MSNYRRTHNPGGKFFFTVVTYHRKPIFNNEIHVQILRDAMQQIINKKTFTIDAIVILPDHLHCIWQLPEDDSDYSNRWREIKKSCSRKINPKSNENNERSVWQRRFWEHVIQDEQDWQNHMDYIHFNPVKHGCVNKPDDWPWSSFKRCVDKGFYSENWGEQEPENIRGMEFE